MKSQVVGRMHEVPDTAVAVVELQVQLVEQAIRPLPVPFGLA